MKSIVVLGSTGSIGVNTLLIAKQYNLKVEALVAGRNVELLNRQIEEFQPKFVAIADFKDRERVNHSNIFCGASGIVELLEATDSKIVVNALVGYAGLAPTLKSIELGKRVALANKDPCGCR